MKIAIDIRITYNNDQALRRFTREFWRDVTISQPGHDFIFITNEKMPAGLPANVIVRPLKKTKIQWIDNLRLKKLLVELKTNKLITVQETGFVISNDFENPEPATGTKNNQVVFTGSTQLPEEPVSLTSTTLIDPALREVITILTWADAESIKTQYTGGRSFFLFTGNISQQHQLIELLKAFSLFKKWQQSNMQLVMAGSHTEWAEVLEEKLRTYKYKEDVVLLKNISNMEMAKLVAASYALVYPAAGNVFPFALLWAVQANKAVIATDTLLNRQLTAAAAWVETTATAEGFAKAMILLYKDEQQQQLLIRQTKEQAKQFSRQQMIADTWQCITQ